jgi:hypothetical protein
VQVVLLCSRVQACMLVLEILANLKISTCLCPVLPPTNSTYILLPADDSKSQIMMLAQLILQLMSISIDSYHLQNLVYRYAVSNFDLIEHPACCQELSVRVYSSTVKISEILKGLVWLHSRSPIHPNSHGYVGKRGIEVEN